MWWVGDHWLVSKPEATSKKADAADYVIEQFSATSLGKSGRPLHQLQASSYEFFAANSMANLEKPQLVQYEGNQPATYTQADNGVLDTKSRVLHLKGNVIVRQGKQKDRGPVQLKTNELTVELR